MLHLRWQKRNEVNNWITRAKSKNEKCTKVAKKAGRYWTRERKYGIAINEKRTRTLLKWIAHHSIRSRYELRTQIEEMGDVYIIRLSKHRTTLCVSEIREKPGLIGKALHLWATSATYHTLTNWWNSAKRKASKRGKPYSLWFDEGCQNLD